MRGSLLLVAAGVIAVGVACAAVTRFDDARAQEPPRTESASVDRATLDRDLEIMRRLLAREGLGVSDARLTTTGESQAFKVFLTNTDSAVEAFHVAGDGALFLVRTSDAVAAPPGEVIDDTAPKPARTAWDEIADEVEGRPRVPAAGNRKRRDPSYDAQKVEALRARILEQLAKNGDRIRGLGAEDCLTVVVTGGAQLQYGAVHSPVVIAQTPGSLGIHDYVLQSGRTGRSVLTIRVKVADCRRSAKGEIDLDEFRRRAVIAAY